MLLQEYGSADITDLIKVSGKSALSDCLGQILNHLDTSLSIMTSELASGHAMIQIDLGEAF